MGGNIKFVPSTGAWRVYPASQIRQSLNEIKKMVAIAINYIVKGYTLEDIVKQGAKMPYSLKDVKEDMPQINQQKADCEQNYNLTLSILHLGLRFVLQIQITSPNRGYCELSAQSGCIDRFGFCAALSDETIKERFSKLPYLLKGVGIQVLKDEMK